MLSEGLRDIMLWLKKNRLPDGWLVLDDKQAEVLIGSLGGYWGDAMGLERECVPEHLRQVELGRVNGSNVISLDLVRRVREIEQEEIQ